VFCLPKVWYFWELAGKKMTDFKLIQKCLRIIEQKLNWGPANNWATHQFQELSELIHDKTGIMISVSSLRRLYGKEAYKEQYKPQTETKNALALYIDYNDWADFYSKHKSNRVLNKKNGIALFIVLVVFALTYLAYDYYQQEKKNMLFEKAIISSKNLFGKGVPHTVFFNYDISMIKDSVFVDFGDASVLHNYRTQSIYLVPQNSVISHTYNINRLYHVRFFTRKNTLKIFNVLINTEGWEGMAEQNTRLYHYKEKEIITDSVMKITPAQCSKAGIDTNDIYYLYYRNIRNYNTSMDDLEFETRVFCKYSLPLIECPHFQLNLLGEEGRILLTFSKTGCESRVNLIISEKEYKGSTHDFSRFCFEHGKWVTIKTIVKDMACTVFLDNELIYSTGYNQALGTLKGIRYEFKGYGKVRYARLNEEILKPGYETP
jgi:hypothetical protein